MLFIVAYQLVDAFGIRFNKPVFMINDPTDSGRFYVVEQVGVILSVKDGKVDTLLDIRNKVKYGGEMGLLGMALHPDFHENGKYYVSYTDRRNYSVVEEYIINRKDYSRKLIEVKQPYSNHNGGHIAFGKDGYLYIALGDGGSAGDPLNHAQNTNTLLGSILRIDVDGQPYSIPKDNPFVDGGGRPEIYAYGLRNPWRFSFDGNTLWVGDVGQDRIEEIDTIVKGGNYGWRCYEGSKPYNLKGCKGKENYIFPIYEYTHEGGNCSVIGGYVYRGKHLKELYGAYIFGDFCSGRIWALYRKNRSVEVKLVKDTDILISSFALDGSGEIYVLGYRSGRIYKLVR